jgi:hypothetical protein
MTALEQRSWLNYLAAIVISVAASAAVALPSSTARAQVFVGFRSGGPGFWRYYAPPTYYYTYPAYYGFVYPYYYGYPYTYPAGVYFGRSFYGHRRSHWRRHWH